MADTPKYCEKCERYFRGETEHVASIMRDIQVMIHEVGQHQWARIKQQVEQKRLE